MNKERGALIVMYSGEGKPIEKVSVGDVLMGDDKKPQKIIRVFSGYALMYRLVLDIGSPIIIARNHVLCFKVRNPNKIFYVESAEGYRVNCLLWSNNIPTMLTRFFGKGKRILKKDAKNTAVHYLNEMLTTDCCLIDGDVIEITLERFVNLDVTIQKMLKLYNINGQDIEIINITIEKGGDYFEQEYFGFKLDGNGRYIHSDGLVMRT
jgi:hypothetical protein